MKRIVSVMLIVVLSIVTLTVALSKSEENKAEIANDAKNVSIDSTADINMDFSFVKKGMSIDELSKKLGSEAFVTGSGVTYYNYSIKKNGAECTLQVVSYSEPIVEGAWIIYSDVISKKIVTFKII